MKIVRKEKKNKKNKTVNVNVKTPDYTLWKVREKKYSEYPYIVTVSFFRKNVFISASDLRGRIKLWTNAGRFKFKGADKIQYLAIVEVAQKFFKKLLNYGIRDIFLKFSNFRRPRAAIRKAIRSLKLGGKKRKYAYKPRKKWVNVETKIKINGKIRTRIKKIQKTFWRRKRGNRKLRFLGIWTELHISFNGCRNKKQRRKRHRRRAKRIRLK